MMEDDYNKVIIVEGLSDKKHIEKILDDNTITIVCTNGTIGIEKLEELLESYHLDDTEVFILVDEDDSGIKLRKQLARELPHAEHIYVSSEFREVAATPMKNLASTLAGKSIGIDPNYLANW